MKVSELSFYYAWADKRIINLLNTISNEQFTQKLNNERSLKELSAHLVASYEMLLLHNLNNTYLGMKELEELSKQIKNKSKNELLEYWGQILERLIILLMKISPKKELNIPTGQQSLTKAKYEELIFSFTDHSTYHRGQLITTFKIITGNEAINTDYYTYLITQKSAKK